MSVNIENVFNVDLELIISCENAVMAKNVISLCLIGKVYDTSKPGIASDDTTVSILSTIDDDDDDERVDPHVKLIVLAKHVFSVPINKIGVSSMLKNKHQNMLMRTPLFFIRDCLIPPGDLSTGWFYTNAEKIDWDLTYHHVLKTPLSFELTGKDMQRIGVCPLDASSESAGGILKEVCRESVTKCIHHSKVSWLIGKSLAANHLINHLFGSNDFAIKYHLFSGGKVGLPTAEPKLLASVKNASSFSDYCDKIRTVLIDGANLVEQLQNTVKEGLDQYRWMDYQFTELLTNSLKLAYDASRLNNFFEKTTDAKTIITSFGRERGQLLDFDTRLNAMYSELKIRVTRVALMFLRAKLGFYHPSHFTNHVFQQQETFKPINQSQFSSQVRARYHMHKSQRCLAPAGIRVSGRVDLTMCCMSAVPDIIYSGCHHSTTDTCCLLPCPIFSRQDEETVWNKIIASDPTQYQKVPISYFKPNNFDLSAMITKDLDETSWNLTRTITRIRRCSGLERTFTPNLHEVFNRHLSLGAIPFDIDLKGYEHPPSFSELCIIARSLQEVVQIFVNMLLKQRQDSVLTESETYVFKSECDGDDDDDDDDDRPKWLVPCNCRKKLGIHVSVTLPPNVIIKSIMALGSAADLFVSLCRSMPQLIALLIKYGGDMNDAFDTKIWHPNKSLRLPYSRKVGQGRRLMPVYVVSNHDDLSKNTIMTKLWTLASDRYITLIHRDYHHTTIPKDNVVVFEGCMASFRDVLDLDMGSNIEVEIGIGEDEVYISDDANKVNACLKQRLAEKYGAEKIDYDVEYKLARTLASHVAQTFPKCGHYMKNMFLSLVEGDSVKPCLKFNMGPNSKPVIQSEPFSFCLKEDANKKTKKILYFVIVHFSRQDTLQLTLYVMCFKCEGNKPLKVLTIEL